MLNRWLSVGALAGVFAATVSAPVAAQSAEPCTYARCALSIAPRITALDVVRGEAESRAGSLSFVWPRGGVVAAFDGDDVAQRIARQSVRTRRAAAVFTDLGVAVMIGGATYALTQRDHRRTGAAIAGAGAVLLGVSVPIQFAADAGLSRAVFEFNRRFAR